MQAGEDVAEPARVRSDGDGMLAAPAHLGPRPDPGHADPGEQAEGGGAMLPAHHVGRQRQHDPLDRPGVAVRGRQHIVDPPGQGGARMNDCGTNIFALPQLRQPRPTTVRGVLAEQVQRRGQDQSTWISAGTQ